MKFTGLVLKNLLRSKRRTLLTVFSIAVSLFVFSALISLPTVANHVLADSASSLRIACRTKMGQAYPLPEAYKSKIAAMPYVVAVTPDNFFGGIYHDVSDQDEWRRICPTVFGIAELAQSLEPLLFFCPEWRCC